MKGSLKLKLENLEKYLIDLKKVGIAFSGGVDSSFLLKFAGEILGENVKAYTINTVYIPDRDIETARNFTLKNNIRHSIINIPLIDIIQHNPSDRCYFCKTFIFKKIREEAVKDGIEYLAEGTNIDDVNSHRPGLKVLEELKIKSPLKETGFTKNDIRSASKKLNLPTWNKPAYACLLTRLPYGTVVSDKELKMIQESEDYIISLGFDGVRVRSHGNLARIEFLPEHLHKILKNDILSKITKKLKETGYQFVAIDTEGYKQGSFDHTKQL